MIISKEINILIINPLLHIVVEEFVWTKIVLLSYLNTINIDIVIIINQKLFQELKEINAKLWIIEDDKRDCERNKDFGEKFVKLSRDVHFLNDDRAKIKLEINNHTGSVIKEIKEYTSY